MKPRQVDEIERLARRYGLTYLSAEGYQKLADLVNAVVARPEGAPLANPCPMCLRRFRGRPRRITSPKG